VAGGGNASPSGQIMPCAGSGPARLVVTDRGRDSPARLCSFRFRAAPALVAFAADAGASAALGGQHAGVAGVGITPAQAGLQLAGQRGVIQVVRATTPPALQIECGRIAAACQHPVNVCGQRTSDVTHSEQSGVTQGRGRGTMRGTDPRIVPARRVPSMRLPALSVQLTRARPTGVPLVMRRSGVRFPKAAPR